MKLRCLKNAWNWVLVLGKRASQVSLVVKNLPANAGDVRDSGSIPGLGRSLEEGMAPHSSILAWRIPRSEEPGRQQSTGSQRVRHEWVTSLSLMIIQWKGWLNLIECLKNYGWTFVTLYRRQWRKPSQRKRTARKQSYLRKLNKQLRKEDKRKAREKGNDIPSWVRSSRE